MKPLNYNERLVAFRRFFTYCLIPLIIFCIILFFRGQLSGSQHVIIHRKLVSEQDLKTSLFQGAVLIRNLLMADSLRRTGNFKLAYKETGWKRSLMDLEDSLGPYGKKDSLVSAQLLYWNIILQQLDQRCRLENEQKTSTTQFQEALKDKNAEIERLKIKTLLLEMPSNY